MNFTIIRGITANKFSTSIAFQSWGDLGLTSAEEEALLTDFPITLDLNAITFSGKYKIVDTLPFADETTGEVVSLTTTRKQLLLNSDFVITYSIDIKDILDSELGTTILNSKEKVAMAKCILFEDKVNAQLKILLDGVKAKESSFADQNPINITI